jgi:hypothetical protein
VKPTFSSTSSTCNDTVTSGADRAFYGVEKEANKTAFESDSACTAETEAQKEAFAVLFATAFTTW